jgi:hypothetical protein
MAEGKDGEGTDDGAAHAGKAGTPRSSQDMLLAVESPPLSPDNPEPEPAPERRLRPRPEPEVVAAAEAAAIECTSGPESEDVASRLRARLTVSLVRLNSLPLPCWPHVRLRPRHRRRVVLAAAVALAAAFGVVAGSLIGSHMVTPPRDTTAQVTITRLTRQIAAVEAELARAEIVRAEFAANAKSAEEKVVKAEATSRAQPPDITGSIPPASVLAPMPQPRPAGHIASAVSRPPVVRGWTLRLARSGMVLVEGRGEIYQVVPGAPLPGLGPVEAIRQHDGRWVVVTPKGLIVSRRDRRYFE